MFKANGNYTDIDNKNCQYGNISTSYIWDYGKCENKLKEKKDDCKLCYKRFVKRWVDQHPVAKISHTITKQVTPHLHDVQVNYLTMKFYGASRNEDHAYFLVWQQIMNFT